MSSVYTVIESKSQCVILRHAAPSDDTQQHDTSAMDSNTAEYTQEVAARNVEASKCDGESKHIAFRDNEEEKLELMQPPKPTLFEGEDKCIPCIEQKDVSKTTKPKKRNKNETPGKPTILISSGNSHVSMMTTQMSQLEIDGPEVPELGPVSASDISQTKTVQVTSRGQADAQTISAASRGASGSCASMTSLSSVGTEDDLEYGDECGPSLPTSSSESSVLTKTRNQKDDFVILHTDEDIDDAFEYKKHLQVESKKLGIADLKVHVFSAYGYGQSEFGSIENIPLNFHHTLVYVTANLCKDYYTQFLNEMVMKLNLKKSRNCQVTPIFATEEKQPILELCCIPGLPYWRLKFNRCPAIYIDALDRIMKQIRNEQRGHV